MTTKATIGVLDINADDINDATTTNKFTTVAPVEITPAAATIDVKSRIGTNTGTLYINGTSSSRLMGGVCACTMTIREIKV